MRKAASCRPCLAYSVAKQTPRAEIQAETAISPEPRGCLTAEGLERGGVGELEDAVERVAGGDSVDAEQGLENSQPGGAKIVDRDEVSMAAKGGPEGHEQDVRELVKISGSTGVPRIGSMR